MIEISNQAAGFELTISMGKSRSNARFAQRRIAHPAALDPEVLAPQCEFRATRRSGPGGQNRNKVETAVILTHRPTGISAQASERRTQGENRRMALAPAPARAGPVRSPTDPNGDGRGRISPSELWRKGAAADGSPLTRGTTTFPRFWPRRSTSCTPVTTIPRPRPLLGCSPSQLIKLLKECPAPWS